MERPYTGLTAEIKIGDVPLGYMSGLDLTLEKSIIEILQFGARYREKVPAIKNWSATVDGTLAIAAGGSQQKLYNAFENDEEITVGMFLNEYTYFEGKAYVANFNITGAPDDKMNLSCDLEGNGAVILTLPTTHVITVHSGVGGTITPGGATQVVDGGNHVLTIIPASGATVDTLLDNGVDQTAQIQGNRYTLANVVIDHMIDIVFKTSEGADKTKLRAAIAYCDTLNANEYDSSTYTALTTKLVAAKEVNSRATSTQTQVDTATTDLNDAILALTKA